jgi:dienelactone hydrolase
MRAVLSPEAVTMRAPSGLKAADSIAPATVGSRMRAISFPVEASQMRAVLSQDAVTMRVPSGLKAAEDTELKCPRRTAISFPVAASHMCAVWSCDAVTMRLPRGLKAARELHSKTDPRDITVAAIAAVPFMLAHAESNGNVGVVGFCFGVAWPIAWLRRGLSSKP